MKGFTLHHRQIKGTNVVVVANRSGRGGTRSLPLPVPLPASGF